MKTVTLPLLYFYVLFELNICPPFHLFVDRGLPNIIQSLSLLAIDNADPIRECRSDLCAMSIRVSSFIIGNKSILLLIKINLLQPALLRLSYSSSFHSMNSRPLIFFIISYASSAHIKTLCVYSYHRQQPFCSSLQRVISSKQ